LRKIKYTNMYINVPEEINTRSLLGKRMNRKLGKSMEEEFI